MNTSTSKEPWLNQGASLRGLIGSCTIYLGGPKQFLSLAQELVSPHNWHLNRHSGPFVSQQYRIIITKLAETRPSESLQYNRIQMLTTQYRQTLGAFKYMYATYLF